MNLGEEEEDGKEAGETVRVTVSCELIQCACRILSACIGWSDAFYYYKVSDYRCWVFHLIFRSTLVVVSALVDASVLPTCLFV